MSKNFLKNQISYYAVFYAIASYLTISISTWAWSPILEHYKNKSLVFSTYSLAFEIIIYLSFYIGTLSSVLAIFFYKNILIRFMSLLGVAGIIYFVQAKFHWSWLSFWLYFQLLITFLRCIPSLAEDKQISTLRLGVAAYLSLVMVNDLIFRSGVLEFLNGLAQQAVIVDIYQVDQNYLRNVFIDHIWTSWFISLVIGIVWLVAPILCFYGRGRQIIGLSCFLVALVMAYFFKDAYSVFGILCIPLFMLPWTTEERSYFWKKWISQKI